MKSIIFKYRIIIFILLSFVGLFIYNFSAKNSEDIPIRETIPTYNEKQSAVYISPTSTLKNNLIESINFCNTQNIAANGEFEACLSEHIKHKSEKDYINFKGINQYCDATTTIESDRRMCIDNVIGL